MKKTYWLLIIIVFIIAAAIGYWFWQKNPTPLPADQATSTVPLLPSDFLPGSGDDAAATNSGVSPMVLTDHAVSDYWIDAADMTLYTVTADGIVSNTPYGGGEEITYDGDGRPLISAQPSARGDLVLLTTGTRTAPTVALVNVITGKRTFLPTLTKAAGWHPNGKDIVYLRDGDSKNTAGLYIYNVAKGSSGLLSPINIQDVHLEPQHKNAITITEPTTLLANVSNWSFNLNEKTLTPIVPAQPGLLMSWHPNLTGEGLIFTPKTGLVLVSKQGKTTPLAIMALPEKCGFGVAGMLYCAVPNKTPKGLPDSYLQRSIYTTDSLVAITADGKTKSLWNSDIEGQPFDADNLRVSGKTIYFINRYDGYLYSLSLVN